MPTGDRSALTLTSRLWVVAIIENSASKRSVGLSIIMTAWF